jgi:hypothetical protein
MHNKAATQLLGSGDNDEVIVAADKSLHGLVLLMASAAIALPVHAAAQQSCNVVHRTDAFEFSGRVHVGEAYQCQFSPVLSFALVPKSGGWLIEVHEKNRDENLARLTPENNGGNPLLVGVSASHLTIAAESEVATEQNPTEREFIFSPEVGLSLATTGKAATEGEIRQVSEQGKAVQNHRSAEDSVVGCHRGTIVRCLTSSRRAGAPRCSCLRRWF